MTDGRLLYSLEFRYLFKATSSFLPGMVEETAMKQLVRLVNADLPGKQPIGIAMTRVKGVSHSLSNAICRITNIKGNIQSGLLTDDQVSLLEKVIRDPSKHNIPAWMLNRRKDYDTGEDKHLVSSDLKLTREFDIKRMRMIRTYKGYRHGKHLPVRGQRTRAHFRKGASLGVTKKKGKAGRV